MKRHWTPGELAEHWTLLPAERALVDEVEGDDGDDRDADAGGAAEPGRPEALRRDHTRLGLACLLKYFQLEWRFPRSRADVPAPAIVHLAHQLGVPATSLVRYDRDGRMASRHRAAIRAFLRVREATVADQQTVVAWVVAHELPQSQQPEAVCAAFLGRCRALGLEPPTPSRLERHVRTALAAYDEQVCALVLRRLPPETQRRLDALLEVGFPTPAAPGAPGAQGAPGQSALADLKRDAGPLSVETVEQEAAKLERLRRLGLPPDLFRDVPPKLAERFRQRVAAEDLHELRRHPTARRLTLLAAYGWRRTQELTDTLAEVLIDAMRHIHVRAERRVERALLRDIKRVSGKQAILGNIAAASLAHPDDPVRAVVHPAAGGEQTLRDIVAERQASGPGYERTVYTVMRASYSHHDRRLVPPLLRALDVRSNNERHRPAMEALALLRRSAQEGSRRPTFDAAESVPLDGVVRPAWRDLVVTRPKRGPARVNRINYELAALHTVRDKLRCKELWVAGADRYRDPDADLPADFAARRAAYYAALSLPLDADAFIADLQQRLRAALGALDADLPINPHVTLSTRSGGRIKLAKLAPQAHRLAVPVGVVSRTGVAGLALHGGLGLLTRKHGLTADNLLAAEVVTADGRVLAADEGHHADLLWALRGGGGNFGVVTAFEFRAHPVGPEVWVALVLYPVAAAPRALAVFRDFMGSAPDEVMGLAVFWSAPHEAFIPEASRGAPVLALLACHAGPLAEGERAVRPFREVGPPVADLSGPMPFLEAQQLFDPEYPDGRRYYWKSAYLRHLGDDVVAALAGHAARRPSPLTSLDLWALGGAMGRVGAQATAFAVRDAPFLVGIEANWEDAADDAANVAWAREVDRDLQRFSPGGAYLNFPGFGEEGAALVEQSYGANYARLRAIKATYDPGNLFRHNLNIPPGP